MATLYRVVAELSLVTQRLPEILGLVAGHATRCNKGFVLSHDAGGDVEGTIATIVGQLDVAARSISVAAPAVGEAHNHLGHLSDPGDRRGS